VAGRVIRRRGPMVHGVRRKTGWSAGPGTTDGGAASFSTSSTILLAVGSVAVADGLTLVRTRGEVTVRLTLVTSALDGFDGAIGILQVSEEAFAAGAASIPFPVDDSDRDIWVWHQFFSLHPQAVNDTEGAGFARYQIDSKAMRKTTEGDVLCAMVQGFEVGASTIAINMQTRILDKLP